MDYAAGTHKSGGEAGNEQPRTNGMLESLVLSRWGNYIIMLAVLGAVVLLLRGLFGPRGLLRDPYWDKRNQEIRAEEATHREARLRAWRKKHGLPEDDGKNAESADAAAPERTRAAGKDARRRHDGDRHEH